VHIYIYIYIYSNYLHGFQLGFALHETTSHRRSLYFVTNAIKSKLHYTIHKFTFAIYSSMLLCWDTRFAPFCWFRWHDISLQSRSPHLIPSWCTGLHYMIIKR